MDQQIHIAVDAVVFGYKNSELFILLIKRKYSAFADCWALPGGFVLEKEGLKDAVCRELKEESGISISHLEQLYTFGDKLLRDPRGRVITVAYFACVNPESMSLSASTDATDAEWFPSDRLPTLAFDHTEIIHKALARLQAKLSYEPIGFELLDEEFPFSDLENLYTTILQRGIDRRNFRKKILSFDFIEKTGNSRSIGPGRPAELFRFNKKRYSELLKEGIHLDLS